MEGSWAVQTPGVWDAAHSEESKRRSADARIGRCRWRCRERHGRVGAMRPPKVRGFPLGWDGPHCSPGAVFSQAGVRACSLGVG